MGISEHMEGEQAQARFVAADDLAKGVVIAMPGTLHDCVVQVPRESRRGAVPGFGNARSLHIPPIFFPPDDRPKGDP